MPTWFNRLRGGADSPDVAAYKAIRSASKSWFSKIMRHPAAQRFDILKAAKKLTLSVQDRTIVFDDETETAVLMDYYLLDYRPDGKSGAENCVFSAGELTPLEAEFHQANLVSRTSLFEAAAVRDDEPKILLRDRLDKDAPDCWLTDLGLADSFRHLGKVLLFTRVVSLRGLHMTGGFSFAFDQKHEVALIDAYRRAMWSVPEARRAQRNTGHFLGLSRTFGLPQVYEDVVPPLEPDGEK